MSDALDMPRPLPIGAAGRIGVGWWGAVCVIATEASLFGYLLFGYLYDAVKLGPNFLPEQPPSLRYALPAIVLLLLSGVTAAFAERAVVQARRGGAAPWFVATLAGAGGFLALQVADWESKHFSMRSDVYGSLFFTITGFHAAHLIGGMIAVTLAALWSVLGYFDTRRHAPVLIVAAYWYFVVAAGLAVFAVLYLLPYLG